MIGRELEVKSNLSNLFGLGILRDGFSTHDARFPSRNFDPRCNPLFKSAAQVARRRPVRAGQEATMMAQGQRRGRT